MKEREIIKLYQGMTAVDEHYIEEARQDRPMGKKHRVPVWMAACLAAVIVLCGVGYAASAYWGVGSAETISFAELTKPFGTLSDEVETADEMVGTALENSERIADYTNVNAEYFACCPLDGNQIPSLYVSPGYMVIFTQETGGGWMLETGDEITLSLALCEKQSLALEIGYVFDGCYYPLSTTKGHTFDEIFQASEPGEYYFCVTNRSSANAVIESGSIA